MAWLSAAFPSASITESTGDATGLPADLKGADAVFGGSARWRDLAEQLGIAAVPVDLDRAALSIDAEALRADPLAHWQQIADPARPWFQRRVTLMGAESTGKSTLAANLAAPSVPVPEHGRSHEMWRGGDWTEAELIRLAAVHEAHRAALAPEAGPVMIEDTDALTTAVWARMLLGRPVAALESRPLADLYMLLDPDVPFVQDGIRYFDGDARARFDAECRALLQRRGARVALLSGDWQARQAQARDAIAALTAGPPPERWRERDDQHPVHAAGSRAPVLKGC